MNKDQESKGWVRVVSIIVSYFFIVGLFQLIGAFVTGQEMPKEILVKTTEHNLIVSFFGLLGTLLVVYLFMKRIDKLPFMEVGLYPRNHLNSIAIGLFAGLFIMGIGYLILSTLGQIQFVKVEFMGSELLLTILLFLVVSIGEEIFFRGYILRNLMESMNKYIALVISAILFASVHAANPNITFVGCINLFLAGISLGLPYIYTKNLMFPIAFHFSWNFFQSIFGFNVRGIDSYSAIKVEVPESTILNGGNFGFEGSILAILFHVLLIFMLYFLFGRRYKSLKTYGF